MCNYHSAVPLLLQVQLLSPSHHDLLYLAFPSHCSLPSSKTFAVVNVSVLVDRRRHANHVTRSMVWWMVFISARIFAQCSCPVVFSRQRRLTFSCLSVIYSDSSRRNIAEQLSVVGWKTRGRLRRHTSNTWGEKNTGIIGFFQENPHSTVFYRMLRPWCPIWLVGLREHVSALTCPVLVITQRVVTKCQK